MYHSPGFGHAKEHPQNNLQINGGSFTSAGRDVHIDHHTHIYEGPTLDLLSVLGSIDNFRQIQQDTLSKATPKTGEWISEHEVFPVWCEPKTNVRTLWGSGIREFHPLLLAWAQY
jgi:hypothetical protein